MKVLLIHCAYKFRGGEDTVVAEEKKLLEAAGVDVELLAFENDRNTVLDVLQLPFNLRSYRQTVKKIKAFRPDVAHVHNLHFSASPSVLYAVRKHNVPVVCTLHNYRLLCPSGTLFHDGQLFLSSLNGSFSWKAVAKAVYKNSRLLTFWVGLSLYLHRRVKTWHRCQRFIALTPFAQNIFLQSKFGFDQQRFTVKPNFTSLAAKAATNRGEHFLYVGRLSEEKGIRLLLKTFSRLPYAIKFAGDGPLKDELVEACSVHKNMEYLGVLQKTELLAELESATALVFPSVWFEGMPLTIIEAFACGTPVLASRLGAMADMVVPYHNGIHFEAGMEKSLWAAVEEWQALSPQEKSLYRHNARRTYEENYTPQENLRQLLSIYESVVKQRSGSLTGTNRRQLLQRL